MSDWLLVTHQWQAGSLNWFCLAPDEAVEKDSRNWNCETCPFLQISLQIVVNACHRRGLKEYESRINNNTKGCHVALLIPDPIGSGSAAMPQRYGLTAHSSSTDKANVWGCQAHLWEFHLLLDGHHQVDQLFYWDGSESWTYLFVESRGLLTSLLI